MTSAEIKIMLEELVNSDQVFIKLDNKLEVLEYEVREIEIDKGNRIDIYVIF
ncbi:hypothetical protein LCGC14_2672330 [marine sediment metagenome]|uniref:Uncharacterized protein n=1 Tax=marine sediment metagenome TaxID=412755 RepID=A0A0F9AB72_9ZZZZ